MAEISPAELARLLHYCPATGALTWLPRPPEMFRTEVERQRWHDDYCGKPALTSNCQGYRIGRVMGAFHRAHRVAWAITHGVWPTGHIDHINGDRADNRLVNLRDVTRVENQHNMKMMANNTSGVNGVYWRSDRQKWCAAMSVSGRVLRLGNFHTKEEAIAAREAANDTYGFSERHGKAA